MKMCNKTFVCSILITTHCFVSGFIIIPGKNVCILVKSIENKGNQHDSPHSMAYQNGRNRLNIHVNMVESTIMMLIIYNTILFLVK